MTDSLKIEEIRYGRVLTIGEGLFYLLDRLLRHLYRRGAFFYEPRALKDLHDFLMNPQLEREPWVDAGVEEIECELFDGVWTYSCEFLNIIDYKITHSDLKALVSELYRQTIDFTLGVEDLQRIISHYHQPFARLDSVFYFLGEELVVSAPGGDLPSAFFDFLMEDERGLQFDSEGFVIPPRLGFRTSLRSWRTANEELRRCFNTGFGVGMELRTLDFLKTSGNSFRSELASFWLVGMSVLYRPLHCKHRVPQPTTVGTEPGIL